MGPTIAHMFVSFGFGDEHLPISIEVRKTRSKEYSTVAGFFRQYEWKILLSGYAPEYVYDTGRLDRSLPLAELKRRGHVNAAAQAADKAPDFSRRIRVELP